RSTGAAGVPGPVRAPRALVIGAGSIGARHARNLASLGATVLVMDPDPSRAGAVPGCEGTMLDLADLGRPDVVVIAGPTIVHAEHLDTVLDTTDATVMVEKPLATLDDDIDELVRKAGDRTMVGLNLRLYEPVRRTLELVRSGEAGDVVSARLWFGSWLPDWRPDVDYRRTYSARAELGGGVLLDAIHELDLALWLADEPLEVISAVVARLGPLEIDVEDTVRAQLRTPSGVPVEIALDYLSRRYRRGIEVIGTRATIRLDWARHTLEVERAEERRELAVDWDIDRSYQREAERLLAFASGDAQPPVDATVATAGIELARAIRGAAG
ncbi:MAG: Gfo/Idh/MocA family protein, partial [Acidimicrobiales bacterium]